MSRINLPRMIFPLEQHENHQQQHQGSGAERAQDRAKSLLH